MIDAMGSYRLTLIAMVQSYFLLEYGVKDGEFKASKMFADSEQLQNLDRLEQQLK
jgi:hypothetical protein